MIESIEGKRGLPPPPPAPPYVAQVGLFGRPTLEQNVETLSTGCATIVEKGADWFTSHGPGATARVLRSFSVSRPRAANPGSSSRPAGILGA